MINVLVVSARNYYRATKARDLVKKVFDDVSVWSTTRDSLSHDYRTYDLVILDAHVINPYKFNAAIYWSDGMGLPRELYHKILHDISGTFGSVVPWEFGKRTCNEDIGTLIQRVKDAFENPLRDGPENIRKFKEHLQNMNVERIISEAIKEYPDYINVPYCQEIRPLIEAEINKKVRMSEFFDKGLIKYYDEDIYMGSLYPKLRAAVEIKKVISSGPKTIVIFSDEKKIIITNELPGVDSLDLYNRIMFSVIKKNVTPKQFEFFCDYCSIPGSPTESAITNNQLQKKMLRAFVKAVIPNKNFWSAWDRYINHLIHELSDKEKKKIFVVQGVKEKKKKKNG